MHSLEKPKVKIKALRIKDINLLQSIVKEFVQTHRSLSFRDNYWIVFRNWFEQGLNDENTLSLLATIEGDVIGLIVGDIRENIPLLSPDRVGHVSVLVVNNKVRRQGVGDSLWNEMRNWFESRGVKEFELFTEYGNEISGPFWNKRGFKTFLEKRRL